MNGFVLATLGGCAGAGDRYPSLAVRDAERITGTIAVPPDTASQTGPEPAVVVDTGQVAQALATARAAHARFFEALPGVSTALASTRSADVESDAFATAQIALADLDTMRSETGQALARLDALHADAAIVFASDTDLDAARTEIEVLLAEQDAALRRLGT